MAILFALIISIIFIAVVAGPIIYLQSRKVLREQKNFERGLKMVSLKIHLPPPSDETEVGARDIRDVTDEAISQAEILYGILASTLEKGFKSKFYGQRHIGLEVVGDNGIVNFYAAVPISLVEVVKQAVLSAYPHSQLEEVSDHNIFNSVGRISSTFGGELTLKENFAYPIATYQDIKRDPMHSILNALSGLTKEDGVGIQILLRPAPDGWRKSSTELAKKKRKGKKSHSFFGSNALMWFGRALEALWKPPEDSGPSSVNETPLSPNEEAVVSAIEEKTRKPGFETCIRIITSSNLSQQSESLLKNIIASFALFDAPGKNGFKFTAAQDIENFATAYILRFFPQTKNKNILSSTELATLFHFPQQNDLPTTQVSRIDSKQVDGPHNVPEDGLLLGYNQFRGVKKPIRLDDFDRQRHMYVVGQTGTGKSTLIENLALQDMLNGDGFAFIDPHGDTAEKLLEMIPKERTEDVIYFCPADTDYPLGLNIFEADSADEKDFLIQEVINMLYKLYDPNKQGMMGPRFENIFRMAALTVMAGPEGGTFIDIPKLFVDPQYVKDKLQYVTDQNVLDFWQKEMPQAQASREFGDLVSWFVSKFGAFRSNVMMRNVIGQTKSSFDLRDIMDNKKILLVNLSKGRTGDLNSNLLGMLFVMKFQQSAMSRANIPESERVDFCLYVDEFQNFATDSFATIMSEARKYHLNLIVANQFITQLTEEIRDAVFGNAGTIVAYRVGQNDVEILARYFQPLFDTEDLLRVPNYNSIVRTLIRGVPTQAFSMAALPPMGKPNSELGDALKQLSASKYGRPRQVVEREIFDRLRPSSQASNLNAQGRANTQTRGVASNVQPGGPVSSINPKASFLDQWLTKKRQNASMGVGAKNNVVDDSSDRSSNTMSPSNPRNLQTAGTGQASLHTRTAVTPPVSTTQINDNTNAAPNKNSVGFQTPLNDTKKSDKEEAKFEDTVFFDRKGNLHQNS